MPENVSRIMPTDSQAAPLMLNVEDAKTFCVLFTGQGADAGQFDMQEGNSDQELEDDEGDDQLEEKRTPRLSRCCGL